MPRPYPSIRIKTRVIAGHARALDRAGRPNTALEGGEIERFCRPDARGQALIEAAMDRLGLSARAYHRILKMARTIADLDATDNVGELHIAEAIGYRQFDRTPHA